MALMVSCPTFSSLSRVIIARLKEESDNDEDDEEKEDDNDMYFKSVCCCSLLDSARTAVVGNCCMVRGRRQGCEIGVFGLF